MCLGGCSCLHRIVGGVAVLRNLPPLWGEKVLKKHKRALPHPMDTGLMSDVTSEESGCV